MAVIVMFTMCHALSSYIFSCLFFYYKGSVYFISLDIFLRLSLELAYCTFSHAYNKKKWGILTKNCLVLWSRLYFLNQNFKNFIDI